MAALSPAQENALTLWLVVFLAVLLALALAAVITSPPQTDSPPAEGVGAGPYLPKHASEPPAPALPRSSAAGWEGEKLIAQHPGTASGAQAG